MRLWVPGRLVRWRLFSRAPPPRGRLAAKCYKVTFPNGKISIGQDVTDTVTYMGSFDREVVASDFDEHMRRDFVLRKQVL